MDPVKQRAAIAEYCGWKDVRGHMGIPPENGMLFPYPEHHEEDWRLKPFRVLPDYLNDLNAMHKAEHHLSMNMQDTYMEYITDITGIKGWGVCHALAEVRAEAFLKTIGKWEE